MNAGVCTTPCGVAISPKRAAPSVAVRRKAKPSGMRACDHKSRSMDNGWPMSLIPCEAVAQTTPRNICRAHAGTALCRFYIDLPFDDDREREGKRRALAELRLDPDFAAVHLDDALRYGEPQAGAALLAGDRIVGLLELLKQFCLVGCGDARPGITDREME